MRVDIVSIFPAYLDPLRLSLAGRAQQGGLLDVRVHDLRQWTHDVHRTVDDAPYGGGAGMVMRPEPWGEAIDSLLADAPGGGDARPTLLVPTPAGRLFDQTTAARLAERDWLILACGRYEGVDQRVVDHYRSRADELEVEELSIGDYVLNGGEAAALVIVEAIARLVPGFVGNPESLVEESHREGPAPDDATVLLESPVYTRPPTWRGLDVPEILLSGDHARIASWRRDAARLRTAAVRPDLLAPTSVPFAETGSLGDSAAGLFLDARQAVQADAGEILTLQRCCWVAEAQANDSLALPPLTESLGDVERSLREWRTWVVRRAGRLVGSVRARRASDNPSVWEIGRLMVAPDLAGRGLGRALLAVAEAHAPQDTATMRLMTGAGSTRNLRIYRRAGYHPVRTVTGHGTDADGQVTDPLRVVVLEKPRPEGSPVPAEG